jgi:hypothetical protein
MLPVHSHKGGALEGVSPRVFPNLRRTHKYRNLHYVNNSVFISSLFSHFIEKNISMGTWEHVELRELQVVHATRSVLHPFVKPNKPKGLTSFNSPYSKLLDLGLAIILIALTDSITDRAKPCHQRLPHFDFPLFYVDNQLLEFLLHCLPFSNFLNFVAILPNIP